LVFNFNIYNLGSLAISWRNISFIKQKKISVITFTDVNFFHLYIELKHNQYKY